MDDSLGFLLSRRAMLSGMAATVGCTIFPESACASTRILSAEDQAFLDDLERQGSLFFWEQGSEKTGQVLDRARNNLNGLLERLRDDSPEG